MDTSGGGGETAAPATTPAPMAIATGGGSGVVAPDAPLLFTNPTTEEEHRGIPEAVFFDDVPAVGAAHGAAPTIAALDQLLAKYKFWEERFQRRRAALSTKIPDVTRAVDVIQALQAAAEAQGGGANGDGGAGGAKADAAADAAAADAAGGGGDKGTLETHFELSTQLFAKATVKAGRSVCLWLGASVMVEYELSDAMDLLRENLAGAQSQLAEMEGDLAFLRSQMNVVEVNMTRVYNWDVAMRRQAVKAASGGASAASAVASQGKGAIEAAPSAKA